MSGNRFVSHFPWLRGILSLSIHGPYFEDAMPYLRRRIRHRALALPSACVREQAALWYYPSHRIPPISFETLNVQLGMIERANTQ